MKRTAIVLFILACSLAATADTLKGIVQNNTTGKPSAGDEVTLKRIGNGMEDVGKVKTNARGEFSFNVPPAQQPYIIWIQHQGVTYTQRAIPGAAVVARVFDSSTDVKGVNLVERMMVFQTGSAPNTLNGEEIFNIENSSTPPRTLLKPHTLEFTLPEGASITDSSVRTGSIPELKTAVVPQGEKNKYAFVFPIRPGQTQFHIIYSLPYSGKLKIDPRPDSPMGALMVAAPDAIKFAADDSSLYQSQNNPQFPGVNFYVAKNVMPQQKVAFEIAGQGEMPREQASTGGGPGTGPTPRDGSRPGGGLGVPNQMPNPLQSGQWLFLGVLSLFMAAGAVYVYTSNQNAPAAAGPAAPPDRGGMLMEAMREEVFQLESDRIQGKISPQDYQSAKAALDKTLQRAVQRQSSKGK